MKIILGTPIRAVPKPWLDFLGVLKVPVMVSAYELRKVKATGDSPLHTMLQHDGEIWVDSGGYQFLTKGVDIGVEYVAKVYSAFWDASRYLSLDYPPSPRDDEGLARAKFRRSVESYVKLSSMLRREYIDIVPVVHYYRDEDLVYETLKAVINHSPGLIAIGGLVPYVLVTRNVPKNSRIRALRFVAKVTEELGDLGIRVHVLGLGSPAVTPILELIGVDSTDTSTWRVKAAYGKVVLPGGGERHVTGRSVNFGKRPIRNGELDELYSFLKRTGFPYLNKFPDALYTSFEYRALINAWVVLVSRDEPRSGVFKSIYSTFASGSVKSIVERQ